MKKRNDRVRRSGKQRTPFVCGRGGVATFEELARDTEGEVAFEIGSASPQHDVFRRLRNRAGGLEQRGFADAGPGFDQQSSAAAHEGFDRRELRVALDKLGHTASR